MRTHTRWARFAIAAGTLSASIAACDSVLDIEDPKMRPDAAGAAGDPTTGATDSGGTSNGGTNAVTPTGGAGQAGESPVGGIGGEGGTPVQKDCEPADAQCGGADGKTPQICDETGHWVTNTEEADATCPALCAAGKCTECVDDDKRCTACEPDDANCDSNLPQTCVAGVWTDDKKSCAQFCDGGSCVTAHSCDALNTERTTCKDGVSCCKSFLVPGGSFKRDFDHSDDYGDDSFAADISPFLLDKFEVTVGRFRQFVDAYAGVLETTLKTGAGKSPHIADDSGWDGDVVMPGTKEALLTELKSCTDGPITWSDDFNTNNDLPVNCVSFKVAYAFCIWDEGRLPTEAEWNFAAAGGAEQRAYPWLTPVSGPNITDDYANYGEANPGPLAVGSKPLGNSRWGQADLAGNLIEWTLDYFGAYPTTCTDCLNTTATGYRSVRGGRYDSQADGLFVAVHTGAAPATPRSYVGFRCARDSK